MKLNATKKKVSAHPTHEKEWDHLFILLMDARRTGTLMVPVRAAQIMARYQAYDPTVGKEIASATVEYLEVLQALPLVENNPPKKTAVALCLQQALFITSLYDYEGPQLVK